MLPGVSTDLGGTSTASRARTVARVRASAAVLQARAREQLSDVAWFSRLDADVRSWVGVVVDTGIATFLDWLPASEDRDARSADRPPGSRRSPARRLPNVFASVPTAVARAVSLQQTVELLEAVLFAVEDATPALTEPGDEQWLRARVERFGRELAFSAAVVYARAAEQRGAWDARLQALVLDALVAGTSERIVSARAAALGWPASHPVRVVAIAVDESDRDRLLRRLQDSLPASGAPALAAQHGEAVLVVLDTGDDDETVRSLVDGLLPPAAVAVVGPRASTLGSAGAAARGALSGLSVTGARRGQQGPALASELLPERALAGDDEAVDELVETCHKPVAEHGHDLPETMEAFLEAGGNLEAAARSLPVHVNTLRYRLGRIREVTGRDPRLPRDRLHLELAGMFARLPARSRS
jgi:DNA-binding PucR family transcriptional regulator